MRDRHSKAVYKTLEQVFAPEHTALLIIDMQKDLLDSDGAYARNGEDVSLTHAIVPAVVDLVDTAHKADVLVGFTQNTTLPAGRSDSPAWSYFKNYSRPATGGQYTMAGTWGHELIDELQPALGDLVITKHRSDAFVGTDLDNLLRANLVESVVVAGIVTNGCVESTVRHAAFNDYYSGLVGDASASTSQRLHDLAVELLSARHDIVTTAQLKRIWSV